MHLRRYLGAACLSIAWAIWKYVFRRLEYYLVYSCCTRPDDKNVFDLFAFTEEKRKEVRDNIEGRVRLLDGEYVSFVFLLRSGRLRRSPEIQYESLRLSATPYALGNKRSHDRSFAVPTPFDMMFIPGPLLR